MRPGGRLGRRGIPAVSVLPVALLVAACSGAGSTATGTGTATTTATSGPAVTTTTSVVSGDPAVAWVDRVCGEVVTLTETQTAAPPNLANPDTAQALREFDGYIQANIDAVGRAITNLRNVGPSPIAGADQALATLLAGLDTLRQGYQSTKDTFATVNPNDPQAAQAAMLQAFTSLSQGSEQLGRALDGLGSNQALEDAAGKAPSCQKLNATSAPTTTTS